MSILVIHPKDKTTDFLKPIYYGRNDVTVITGGCTKEDVAKAIDEHDHIVMLGHGTPQGLLSMGQFNGKPTTVTKATPSMKPSEAKVPAGLIADLPKGVRSFSTYGQKTVDTGSLFDDDDFDEEDDWFRKGKSYGGGSYGGYGGGYTGYSSYGGSYNSSLLSSYIIDASLADKLKGKKLTAIWCNADQFMIDNELEGFYTGMFISEPAEAKLIGTADVEQWQVEQQNYAFVEVVRKFIDQSPEILHSALIEYYGPLAQRNAVAKYNLKRFYYDMTSASGDVLVRESVV